MEYEFTRLFDIIDMQKIRKWREEVEEQVEKESCDFFKQDIVYEQKLKDAGVSEELIIRFKNSIINRLEYIHDLVNSRLVSYCVNLGKELGAEDIDYHNK